MTITAPLTSRSSAHAALALAAMIALSCATACEPPRKQDEASLSKATEKNPALESTNVTYENSQLSEADQKSVVAVVNGEKITLGEFERRLNDQAPFARARYNSTERKGDFLNNIVQFEILADAAQKKGYDKDPDVVLNLKQAMVRRMVADLIAEKVKPEDITEAEMRAYYEAHKDDYVRPAKRRASQIVVKDEAAVKQLLAELDAEFKADPTHKRKVFALKARSTSIDKPTAQLGGDMRFFASAEDGGTVKKEISDAVFALKNVSQLTEPVKTDQGYHVIMLTAKKARFEKTFDEVKRTIQNRLYREKRTKVEKDFIEEMKKQARIETNEDLLGKIPDPKPAEAGKDPHTFDGKPNAGQTTPIHMRPDTSHKDAKVPESPEVPGTKQP